MATKTICTYSIHTKVNHDQTFDIRTREVNLADLAYFIRDNRVYDNFHIVLKKVQDITEDTSTPVFNFTILSEDIGCCIIAPTIEDAIERVNEVLSSKDDDRYTFPHVFTNSGITIDSVYIPSDYALTITTEPVVNHTRKTLNSYLVSLDTEGLYFDLTIEGDKKNQSPTDYVHKLFPNYSGPISAAQTGLVSVEVEPMWPVYRFELKLPEIDSQVHCVISSDCFDCALVYAQAYLRPYGGKVVTQDEVTLVSIDMPDTIESVTIVHGHHRYY